MTKNPYNTEAVEATAKAAFNNANQIVELAMSRSVELLDKNVKAAKQTVERQTAFANALREARDIEDVAKISEKFSKDEVKALESFSQEIYKVSSEVATELAEANERGRNVAEDLVSDSLEQVAQSIPNGGSQPYGAFLQDAIRNQISTLKVFNNLVEKSITAQREGFNAVNEAVSEVAAAGKKAVKQTAKRK